MRTRTLLVSALLALGLILPAAPASADACLDLDVNINGMQIIDEEQCLPF